MKIVHRIGLRIDGAEPLVTFDIDDDHPHWSAVRQLAEGWGMSDIASAYFFAAASWLDR